MALMTEKRVRHLPVLEGDKVMGIVSIGDLLKSIISKQKFVIDELEHYLARLGAVVRCERQTQSRWSRLLGAVASQAASSGCAITLRLDRDGMRAAAS